MRPVRHLHQYPQPPKKIFFILLRHWSSWN